MRLCPWSLALASSISVLGLESVCPRKGCPWPWPRALCPRLHLCCVQPSENSLKLLHLNIRSLTKNFDALFEFISSLSFTPDLVCLTETRIKNQSLANITIPGCSFAHVNSLDSAGGVAIYISKNFNFKLCKNQHHLHNSEAIWLDISDQKNTYIVAVIYRHPSRAGIDKFLLDFTSCLADISASNKIFYALGDFNINIDKSNRTNTAIEYLNIILSNGALPIITIPTRVTSSSSTIIDLIITNDLKHNLTPFAIQKDMTDHFPIRCFVQNLSPKKQKKIKTVSYYRDKSKFKSEGFCDDVQSKFLAYIINMPDLDCDNLNDSFNGFVNQLRSIIDDHAA